MSQETIRIAEVGIDAFNRRDVNGFIDIATDDFIWLPALPGAVEGSEYIGHSGIRRYFAESESTWEELAIRCDQLRDLGDCVLVLGFAVGRGSGSGVAVETPLAFIIEFRDGRASRASTYLSHAEAFKAVGLEE